MRVSLFFDRKGDFMSIMISENLKRLRKEKGNTQQEIADHLGMSMQSVSKWECGDGYPDIELLPKIAAYYDVSLDYLFGVSEIHQNKINLKQIAATLMLDYDPPIRIGAERSTKIYKRLEDDKRALESIKFESIRCLDVPRKQLEENVINFINSIFRIK